MSCKSRILATKHLVAVALGLLVWFSSGLSQAQISPSGYAHINTADATVNYVLKAMLGYFVAIELGFAILVALACATLLALIGTYISNQGAKSDERQTREQKRSTLNLDQPPIKSTSIVATRSGAISRIYKFSILAKQSLAAVALGVLVLIWSSLSFGQITPAADSYTNTVDATTNYGAKTLLDVDGTTQTSYIQFNLASIPSGATISQASLKLYVNSVTTAGSFNVDYVNAEWLESTIDASNAPPLGGNVASGVNVTTADKNQYILINVTSAVQAWLNGSETNNGIALVANSTFNATFDSKENTTTSHAPELDIAYAGGEGTITGLTTASGSGLTGGGTSGTLNLGLTNACAANQVLEWNGSTWACASAGIGTITGVTAGTDLTGGGSSGNLTLNLDTTKVPLLAASNTFTGNQTVNGNLSATGTVSGTSFEIGSSLFGFGSVANGNAFLGFAGNTTTTGTYNTASGVNALQAITTGAENTAVGYAALQGDSAASGNTAIGYGTLTSSSGSFNTATGTSALYSNGTGYQNTATGVSALYSNTTGFYNTATGFSALRSNTTGSNNTANGYGALNSNTSGNYNTATGLSALYYNYSGNYNTATGLNALRDNSTGNYNTATGYAALNSNISGNYNTAAGSSALQANGAGVNNVGIGYQALYSNVGDSAGDGSGNTAVGVNALYSNNDSNGTGAWAQGNTAVGAWALYSNTTGADNMASGASALASNTTGISNSASGYEALNQNSTGSVNTAVGDAALYSNTTGNDNTAVGDAALYSNTTGSGLTCVGSGCNAPGNINNSTAIGAHAVVEQSNSLVLGGTGDYAVNVGIGTTKPSSILTVGRGAGHPVSDSWETYSSRRWKTNIHPLQDALAKVEQLRGVSYDLKDSGKHEIGVIAEEVGKILPEIVTYENNGTDARGVDYSRLTALLIEAVKQQQTQIGVQQKQIALQQNQLHVQQRLMKVQQRAIAGLSNKVGVLASSLRTAQQPSTTSLASR